MMKFVFEVWKLFLKFLTFSFTLSLAIVIDLFTIPIFIICYLVCKIGKLNTPRIAHFYIVIYPTWKKADFLSGAEFEEYCAVVLKKKGFTHVVVTPASGDFGADIIARDNKGQKWVFQCKRYTGKVSNSAVQEVVAAKAHYKADKAGVMTNSKLTEKARELAWENDVLLFECLE